MNGEPYKVIHRGASFLKNSKHNVLYIPTKCNVMCLCRYGQEFKYLKILLIRTGSNCTTNAVEF